MEPLWESSSLQIGPSSSEMVAQGYELIVISGNCKRRTLQRTQWIHAFCNTALMPREVWIFQQAIGSDWLSSWGRKFKMAKGRTIEGEHLLFLSDSKCLTGSDLIFYFSILLKNALAVNYSPKYKKIGSLSYRESITNEESYSRLLK